MSIGSWSVKNPVLLNVLMVALLLLGAFSVTRLPREQFSEVPFYWATITVPYPGAAPADVEQSVTVPVENEMDGLKNLKQIRSLTREGVSFVQVEFDDGISSEEFARLFQEVQTRFNKVRLPEGTLDAVIDDFSSSDFLPVVEVILSGDAGEDVLNKTARSLEEKLLAVPQVENVTMTGARDRQYRIEVDPAKAAARQVSPAAIALAVQGRSGSIPGGLLETPTREYLVRTDGEVRSAADYENLVVKRGRGGAVVRLSDVAVVRDTLDPRSVSARYNGKTAINLAVAKVVGGNSISVVDGVRKTVETFKADLPEGLTVSFFNDSTVRIRDSISVLVTNALSGFVLLVIILWLFLGWRNAGMTALGIPLTFALTFIILEYLGETLNSNSLFGLVLVLGLIVDHAIVIVENSYRLRGEGLSLQDAAIQGTDQVVWPVTSGTLTTVAAFLPLMLLPGILGRFLRVIPLVVSVALLVSTVEAFTFLPLHFSEWGRDSDKNSGAWFGRIEAWFTRLFARLYPRRLLVLGGGLVVMIGVFSLLGRIPQNLFAGEDYTYFFIEIEMPVGTPRGKTASVVQAFEERILAKMKEGEIQSVTAVVGQGGEGTRAAAQNNVAQLVVDLAERGKGRSRPISAVLEEVKDACSVIPGTESVQYRRVQSGPPVDAPVSFRLFGDNLDDLAAVSGRLKAELANYKELYNIKDNLERGTPELRIAVNRDRAADYGLTTGSIGAYIRAGFDGITATRIFDNNEEIDIIVQYRRDGVSSVEQLQQLKIPAPDGRRVPFTAVASVRETKPIAAIRRLDGRREATVSAEAWDRSNIKAINKKCKEVFDWNLKQAYPGVEFKVGGEFAEFANVLIQILRLFLIGIFLIYLILGAQFKSYLQPALIIFTVPFAFVGVILFLVISGTPFSTTVLYAGVALAGIAVNDSIVLISFINRQREAGKKIADAVTEAVRVRLRPIVMTSVTTIAGLLPTAIGIGGYSAVWGPMAATIIFGLIFSTITALVAVPCLYGVLGGLGKRQ